MLSMFNFLLRALPRKPRLWLFQHIELGVAIDLFSSRFLDVALPRSDELSFLMETTNFALSSHSRVDVYFLIGFDDEIRSTLHQPKSSVGCWQSLTQLEGKRRRLNQICPVRPPKIAARFNRVSPPRKSPHRVWNSEVTRSSSAV